MQRPNRYLATLTRNDVRAIYRNIPEKDTMQHIEVFPAVPAGALPLETFKNSGDFYRWLRNHPETEVRDVVVVMSDGLPFECQTWEELDDLLPL